MRSSMGMIQVLVLPLGKFLLSKFLGESSLSGLLGRNAWQVRGWDIFTSYVAWHHFNTMFFVEWHHIQFIMLFMGHVHIEYCVDNTWNNWPQCIAPINSSWLLSYPNSLLNSPFIKRHHHRQQTTEIIGDEWRDTMVVRVLSYQCTEAIFYRKGKYVSKTADNLYM